tara:strand:+ start:5297 stop:5533 length:237 start_codon:yes stop_codon:yes gene_type:complete
MYKDIYVIIIIDSSIVKWEIFKPYNTISDVIRFIFNRYNKQVYCSTINECGIDTDDYLKYFIEYDSYNAITMKVNTFK